MKATQTDLIELHDARSAVARPERADAQGNHARLLQTAATLFAERGVTAVTMTEIARAAGVGQGTLYRHFANKSDLCMALIDAQMCDFQEQVLSQLRMMTDIGETYLAQLAWFIGHYIRFQQQHKGLLGCVGHELTPSSPTASGAAIWLHLTIQGLLRGAAQQGEIATEPENGFLIAMLEVLLRPDVVEILRETQEQEPETIIAGLQRLVYRFQTK